jgi:hypothetical protein
MNTGSERDGQPSIRVRIGTLRVTAASVAEARRLTDALPAAIERALRQPTGPGSPTEAVPAGNGLADQVAAAVVKEIRAGGPA